MNQSKKVIGKPKAKSKIKKPRYNQKYTIEEMLVILDTTIALYRASTNFSYYSILLDQSTHTKSTWGNYLAGGQYPNKEIQAKFRILKDIQEDRAIEGAMTGQYNPTFTAFVLRTKHGYVEQQHQDRLAFDEKKLASGSIGDTDQPLNINFTIAEHRTEEQIDRLLNDE